MAMNLEGQGKKGNFLSNRLSESVSNLSKITAYFQYEASLADKGKTRCTFSNKGIHQNELVFKVEKCGHVYCADNYIKQIAVRADSDIDRQATCVRHAMPHSTSLTSLNITWIRSFVTCTDRFKRRRISERKRYFTGHRKPPSLWS